VKIGINSLKPEPIWLEQTETAVELHLAVDGVEFPAPVRVKVKVTRMQEDVLAQGRVWTAARLACSRCLEPFDLDLEGSFDALFVPDTGAYATRKGRRDFEWGDERVNFYSEMTIDLSAEIRECLELELPLKPLCRPSCAGLCPQCGKDLNDGPCDCPPDEGDDPWAALRKLIPPKQAPSD